MGYISVQKDDVCKAVKTSDGSMLVTKQTNKPKTKIINNNGSHFFYYDDPPHLTDEKTEAPSR